MGKFENRFLNLLKWWISLPIKYKWAVYFLAIVYMIWSELYLGVNRFFPMNIIGGLLILGYLQNSLFLSFHYSQRLFRDWTKSQKGYLHAGLIIGIFFIPGFCTFKMVDEIRKYELRNNSEIATSVVMDIHRSDDKVKYEFQVNGWNYKGWTDRERHELGDKIRIEYSKMFPALNRELE